jgi:hypothetical protein
MTLTERRAQQLLDRFTSTVMPTIGFSRLQMGQYERPELDATAFLFFPCRLKALGSAFAASVGLRFEQLAPWLDDNLDERPPTFAIPINLLREAKNFTEWEFSDADDLEKLRAPLLSDLRKYALPFIQRYSRLSELRKTLESPDKTDWFSAGLNVDTRITTLAAILVAQGDKAGAIKTLDDGIKALEVTLADRPHHLRKRRFELAYLRRRLDQ